MRNLQSAGFTVLFLLTMVTAQAQRLTYREITEKRIEYIAPRLDLKSGESEKFWPIFREFYEQREQIARKTKERNKQFDDKAPTSNEDYINAINFIIENKSDQVNLMKEYLKKYLEIIPAEKVYRLYQLDEDFNKFLLNKIKESGGQGRKRE
jgi:hypothetical protein